MLSRLLRSGFILNIPPKIRAGCERWEEGQRPKAVCRRLMPSPVPAAPGHSRLQATPSPLIPLTGGVIYRIKEDLGARVPFAGSAAALLILFFPRRWEAAGAEPSEVPPLPARFGAAPRWDNTAIGSRCRAGAGSVPANSLPELLISASSRVGNDLQGSVPSPELVCSAANWRCGGGRFPPPGGAVPVPPPWFSLPLGNPNLGVPGSPRPSMPRTRGRGPPSRLRGEDAGSWVG